MFQDDSRNYLFTSEVLVLRSKERIGRAKMKAFISKILDFKQRLSAVWKVIT